MKTITAKRVSSVPADAKDVATVMDAAGIPFTKVETVNWEEYPYRPTAEFRIAHDSDNILLHYRCEEEAARAEAKEDNGHVWEDSCMEFFVSFDGKRYYNIESNCIGTVLCANGEGRANRQPASKETLRQIRRHATLASKMPADGETPVNWELMLVVPRTVFFNDRIESLDDMDATCNFYKCGDKLPTPHFLSWNPIDVPSPDFHRPEFFGNIHFE